MNKDIENMKKKSTSGNIGKKTGHKMNITREDYLKRLGITIGLTATITAFTIGGGHLLSKKIDDSLTISTTRHEYYRDLVQNPESPNWHPTDSGSAIWYDEAAIAHDLKELDSNDEYGYQFDVGLASVLDHLEKDETDTVLRYTNYGGLDEYLEQKGYDDIDSFQESIDKQIIVKSKLDEKQKELDDMRNETENNLAQANETAKAGEK